MHSNCHDTTNNFFAITEMQVSFLKSYNKEMMLWKEYYAGVKNFPCIFAEATNINNHRHKINLT